MAEDVMGLLVALIIDQAHIVGQSLGGMIAQELVLRRPDKAASLCLIYTTPSTTHILNERDHSAIATQPRARSRQEAIEQYLQNESFAASRAYEFDTAWIRTLGGFIWDHCYYPQGIPRQLHAVLSSPDRTAALGTVTAPTLIIHGDADRLIDVSASHVLAQALPHATLRIFAGMGHELPPPLWPELIQAITANTNSRQPAGQAMPDVQPGSTTTEATVRPSPVGPGEQGER
jgi:pimeloyl-ACP methyl ester carboxylesterase